MDNQPTRPELDGDKLHTSPIGQPADREPAGRLVGRLPPDALGNRRPSKSNLPLCQMLSRVGMDLERHLFLHYSNFRMTKTSAGICTASAGNLLDDGGTFEGGPGLGA